MPGPVERHKLARGMGSLIRYSKDGPWTWQRRDSRNNRWIRRPTNEINCSKAEQWVYQAAAADRSVGRNVPDAAILFTTVAKKYVDARSVGVGCNRLRPESIKKVRTALRSFAEYVGDDYESLRIAHVDEALLDSYVKYEHRRVSAEAANSRLNVIGQILVFALKQNCISRDPSPKVERAFADHIEEEANDALAGWPCPTPKEVQLIIANAAPKLAPTGEIASNGSARGRQVYRGINANDYTDLYASICMTGMRRAEALYLTWDDVDFDIKVILIRPGKKNGIYWQPKSRASIRRIAIVPQLEAIFERLRDASRNNLWVFESRRGTQMSLGPPTKRLGEISDELGLENRYVLHSLRKYWASTVAQQGMDWKVMLKMFGHHDFELILSTYYAQNDDERMLAEASKIDFGLDLNR